MNISNPTYDLLPFVTSPPESSPLPPIRGASLFLHTNKTIPALKSAITGRITEVKNIHQTLYSGFEASANQAQDAEKLRSAVTAIASLRQQLSEIEEVEKGN